MCISKPIAAIGAGCVLLLGMAAMAQSGGAAPGSGSPTDQVLVLESGILGPKINRIREQLLKSDVVALQKGVIETVEVREGMPVKKNGVIAVLHHEIAELTVRKNQLQAKQLAPLEKARAQKDVAASVVARNKRLNERTPGMVSAEDVAKAEGDLKVAAAQIKEALEATGIAEAELALAERTLAEHTIVAPFDGIVLKRMKNPGESVAAQEAVVLLADLTKLSAEAYVPLEYSYRVREGQVVEVQPRIMTGKGEPLPIEKKRFRGKVAFVDPQIQYSVGATVKSDKEEGERAVRIRAVIDNPDLELRPGLWVKMTIFLNSDAAATNPGANEPTRTARSD
jgi:RND family efflux transporter MFP subunit